MAYATVEDVALRLSRTLGAAETSKCETLIADASVMIDTFAPAAEDSIKKLVVCRMVVRALGDGYDAGVPIGATQGTVSALGYSQSWTVSGGSAGELYVSKTEKHMLGYGNRIGSASPIEGEHH